VAEREDEGALRGRFRAEVEAAGLTLSPDDAERLYAMWRAFLPERRALRAVALAADEEPGP